jgi:hypothetical protein
MRRPASLSLGSLLLLASVAARADTDVPAPPSPPSNSSSSPSPSSPPTSLSSPSASVPDAGVSSSELPAFADDGELLAAVSALLASATDPVRVAVIVEDDDATRRLSLERALVRVMRERRREEVVTPALVRGRLEEKARIEAAGASLVLSGLSADHVIVAAVVTAADRTELLLKILSSERGAVLAARRVAVMGTVGSTTTTTVRARSVGTACADLADELAEAVESQGRDIGLHRVAVAPVQASGAAEGARLDRFLHRALTEALKARGFLVVERVDLERAMEQLSLQQLLGETQVAQVGRVLGAQDLVLASVSEAGDRFLVTARLVGVESGRVGRTAQAALVREGVVTLAAVETRTPAEAAMRSAVAPGWGQAYNGEGMKALLIGGATYGAFAGTVALATGALWSRQEYLAVRPGENGLSVEEASQRAVGLREQANVLWTTTAVAGALSASLWSLGIADAVLSSPDVD